MMNKQRDDNGSGDGSMNSSLTTFLPCHLKLLKALYNCNDCNSNANSEGDIIDTTVTEAEAEVDIGTKNSDDDNQHQHKEQGNIPASLWKIIESFIIQRQSLSCGNQESKQLKNILDEMANIMEKEKEIMSSCGADVHSYSAMTNTTAYSPMMTEREKKKRRKTHDYHEHGYEENDDEHEDDDYQITKKKKQKKKKNTMAFRDKASFMTKPSSSLMTQSQQFHHYQLSQFQNQSHLFHTSLSNNRIMSPPPSMFVRSSTTSSTNRSPHHTSMNMMIPRPPMMTMNYSSPPPFLYNHHYGRQGTTSSTTMNYMNHHHPTTSANRHFNSLNLVSKLLQKRHDKCTDKAKSKQLPHVRLLDKVNEIIKSLNEECMHVKGCLNTRRNMIKSTSSSSSQQQHPSQQSLYSLYPMIVDDAYDTDYDEEQQDDVVLESGEDEDEEAVLQRKKFDEDKDKLAAIQIKLKLWDLLRKSLIDVVIL